MTIYNDKKKSSDATLFFVTNLLLQLVAQVEVIYKCSYEVCTENKQCNQNLNYQICCSLLCKKIINTVQAPA